MTEPSATNRVSLPAMNDGRNEVWRDRSTTTWKVPLAASNRLRDVIDFSSGGWLRTVVVVWNGLRSCGSKLTAESTSSKTATAATAAATTASGATMRRGRGMGTTASFGKSRLQLPSWTPEIRCIIGDRQGIWTGHGRAPIRWPATAVQQARWMHALAARVDRGAALARRAVRRIPEGHEGQRGELRHCSGSSMNVLNALGA